MKKTLEIAKFKSELLALNHEQDELFAKIPNWQAAEPIILGSWGRYEFCPKSDIDLLFLGPEDRVRGVVAYLQQLGFKVRARVPQDINDWTVGVQNKDLLALFDGRAWTSEAAKALAAQLLAISSSRLRCRQIFNQLIKERKLRNKKFDSMSNFLEPNLKQGPGGLRDIQLAQQMVRIIDNDRTLPPEHHALTALQEAKDFLLVVRMRLHQHGFQDQLVGTEQIEIAQELGFLTQKDFMRQLSRSLARGYFYSEWVFAYLQQPVAKQNRLAKIRFSKPADLMKALEVDSSILSQQLVRTKMDEVYQKASSQSAVQRGRLLGKAISYQASDELTKAVFQSRLIDKLCPRIRPLVGYVQHDQYHRFTAESHLLLAVREVKRIWHHPRQLGKLQWIHKKFTLEDWEILSWTALYHDLAKGQEDDHSLIGEQWVDEDLRSYKVSEDCRQETKFLVRHHLDLSLAAFKKNPQDPRTWLELFERGFTERRIYLLAAFTVIDIRATNPEAWNLWKANLLNDCVKAFTQPEKREFYQLTHELKGRLGRTLDAGVDPLLSSHFSLATIKADIKGIQNLSAPEVIGVKVLRDRKKRCWLRFSTVDDQVGVFASFVKALFLSGISVQQAIIQTVPGLGVYDLFQISNKESGVKVETKLRQIQKLLQNKQERVGFQINESLVPKIKLQMIEIVSVSDIETVLSFKGLDQRGLLWAITERLAQEKISIRSARVHTWGQQVDDLIHLEPGADVASLVKVLREEWVRA